MSALLISVDVSSILSANLVRYLGSYFELNKKYVAFLRGINLGKRNIKMDDLIHVFTSLGYAGVQTVIASGNVLFEAEHEPLAADISNALLTNFGFEVGVILRSVDELKALAESNPFSACADLGEVKLYHTLSATKIDGALDGIKDVPGDFSIILINERDYFTLAYRQASGRFGAGLDGLEKIFKNRLITTRNWNTMLKIVKKAREV